MQGEESGKTEEDLLLRVKEYCTESIRDVVEALVDQAETWEAFVKLLKKEYRRWDTEYQKTTLTYLEALVQQPRTKTADVRPFCLTFTKISKPLIENGDLTEKLRTIWFLKGLPEEWRRKVARKVGTDYHEIRDYPFSELRKATLKLLSNEESLDEVVKEDEQRKLFTEAIKENQRKVEEERAQGYTFQPRPAPTTTAPQMTRQATKEISRAEESKDAGMEELLRKMNQLQIAIMENPRNSRMPAPSALVSGGIGYTPFPSAQRDGARPGNMLSNSCFLCWQPDHFATRCPEIEAFIRSGYIIRDESRKICWTLPEGGHSEPIRPPRGMSIAEWVKQVVANAPRQGLPATDNAAPPTGKPGASVKWARVNAVEFDLDTMGNISSEEEFRSDSDASAEAEGIEVQAARIPDDRRKPARPSQTEEGQSFKVVKRQERERKLPTVKAPRTGYYERAEREIEQEQPEAPKARRETVRGKDGIPKERILRGPADEGTPKNVRPAQPNLKDTLRKDGPVDANDLVHRVLREVTDTRLSFSLRELFELSPMMQRALVGRPTQSSNRGAQNLEPMDVDTPSARVSALRIPTAMQDYMEKVPYLCPLPRVQCEIAGFEAEPAMIDTGSQVNVMGDDYAEIMNLEIKTWATLKVSGVTGDGNFVGLIDRVPVKVGRITTFAPFFVLKDFHHGVILGRVFSWLSRMEIKDCGNGETRVTVWGRDGDSDTVLCDQNDPGDLMYRSDVRLQALNAFAESRSPAEDRLVK